MNDVLGEMFGFGGGKDPSVQGGQSAISLLKPAPALRVVTTNVPKPTSDLHTMPMLIEMIERNAGIA